MSNYHVYGIGNALVDIEYEISPELMAQMQIDKGVMTLIEEDRHHSLLEQFSDRPCKKSCGGSAANTIIAVSQFGGKGFYSCKVAQDETGTFYLEDLLRNGVETNLQHQTRPEGVTGKCLVFVTPDADRTMNTYLGITGSFGTTELVPDAIAASEYLYIEGYLVSSPTGQSAAIKAREIASQSGVKTALSLSDINMVNFFKQGLWDIIGPGLDFIFANESEALTMAETDTIDEAVAHLKTLAKRFAITLGAKGSIIFDGEKLIEIPAISVQAIDTVGAGDMYAGAFLYGMTHGMSDAEAGQLAAKAAGRIVTTYGPRLSKEETRSLLEE
ncbi:adenosine kinase [Laspinema sp. D1]|uniref:Adenosine kinase n=1 Tax=Laspinema palackyanum D2a TaxID=2953684 RepID=A0ABT2MQR6_9CYAN|nr:adenosine kinase [Laspinema sp. D2a]